MSISSVLLKLSQITLPSPSLENIRSYFFLQLASAYLLLSDPKEIPVAIDKNLTESLLIFPFGKINLLDLGVCEEENCRCGWYIEIASNDYGLLQKLILWLNQSGLTDFRKEKQTADIIHNSEFLLKIILGKIIKTIIPKNIISMIQNIVHSNKMKQEENDPQWIIFALETLQNNLDLIGIIKEGEKHGYKPCCIDFFTRCHLIKVDPYSYGGSSDPAVQGYVRCPECSEKIKAQIESQVKEQIIGDLC